jgi:hypothetical protein
MNRSALLFALMAVAPCAAGAQTPAPEHDHAHPAPADGAAADTPATHDHASHDPATHDHAAMHGTAGDSMSDLARDQVATVLASVSPFASPGAARASGFRPALGMIPTMGTHWVNVARMLTGTGSDLTRPEHLMFSPIDGVETLVGVAFAYQALPDQATPELFDGELDTWHTHPEISPPGRELTMLHVWFVESPDGPFAGHNPWLAYWAVGLEPPEATRLADEADSYRIRALGLALAETIEDGRRESLLFQLARSERLPDLEPRRERIRELIPVLDAAHEAGDLAAWNAAADEAVVEWEAIRAANLAAVRLPQVRDRLGAFYEEMLTGGHGAH